MAYVVFEKQNVNGTRDPSFKSESSLTSTKRRASKNQVWQGTVLVVESESGEVVSYKLSGERWTDIRR